jgi:hypothetical protein
MGKDVEAITERVRITPPSCLSGFLCAHGTLPKPWDDNPRSVWQVTCSCGSTTGRLLGYPLREIRRDYDGPECFLSPLAFECGRCGTTTELLDTDKHGFHAEVARIEGGVGSSKLRGDGPRQAYSCPSCGGQDFDITVGFVFWDVDELAEEFDSDWENLFNVFLCYSRCAGCGQLSQPTDFGKL